MASFFSLNKVHVQVLVQRVDRVISVLNICRLVLALFKVPQMENHAILGKYKECLSVRFHELKTEYIFLLFSTNTVTVAIILRI